MKLKHLVVAVAIASSTAYAADYNSNAPYSANIYVGGFYQNHSDSFENLDIMVPVLQNRSSVLFLDGRGLTRSSSAFEGNIGLGLRQLNDDQSRLYGVYSYFDRRRSADGNYFNQITAGGELKTTTWLYGANVYIPIGPKSRHDANYDYAALVSGSDPVTGFDNILYRTGEEKVMPGIDAEVGREIPAVPNLTAYLGGYYFHTKDVPTVVGPRARLTYDIDGLLGMQSRVFNNVSLQAMVQHDNIRATTWYAGVRVGIGASNTKSKHSGLEKHMMDYVQRDVDVVSAGNTSAPKHILTNPDGTPVTASVVGNSTDLEKAINGVNGHAGAQVIVVNGNISGLNTITLNNGQTLTGGNYVFGKNVTLHASTGGNLYADGSNDLIQVGQNNTIRDIGLYVEGIDGYHNGTPNAITNDGTTSVENLLIHNINTNGTINIISTDGQNSNINIENSQFIYPFGAARTSAIYLQAANAGTTLNTNIVNNNIQFNAADTYNNFYTVNRGINLVAVDNASLNVNDIRGNTIGFGASGANKAINIQSQAGSSLTNVTISNISENNISFNGNKNYGISLYSDAGGNNSSANLVVNQITNNHFTFGAGDENRAISSSAGPSGNDPKGETATLTINAIINNIFDFAGGDKNRGITATSNSQGNSAKDNLVTVNMNNIANNAINFGNGNNNRGIYLLAQDDIGIGYTKINVNNVYNNTVNFGVGTNNSGLYAEAGRTVGNNAIININGISGNLFRFANSDTLNNGFYLKTLNNAGGNVINIRVSKNQSLSDANNGTNIYIVPSSNVVITE